MRSRILIINGPGLGDIGGRESDNESGLTLDGIRETCEQHCADLNLEMDFRQTDDQQALLQWLSEECEKFDGLILNPVEGDEAGVEGGGFYDSAMQAVAQSGKPAIEVRLSNVYKAGARNSQHLHKPAGDMGFVCGFGLQGYLLAINAMAQRVVADA
jgi:3-dehydroquinate dehydratase-2